MTSEQILSQEFIKTHPIEAVRELEQLPVEEIAQFLLELPVDLAVIFINLLIPWISGKCLEKMDSKKAWQNLCQSK